MGIKITNVFNYELKKQTLIMDITLGIMSTLNSLLDPKLSGGLSSFLNRFQSYAWNKNIIMLKKK